MSIDAASLEYESHQHARIVLGYEDVPIDAKGPDEAGLHAGPILHCSGSGASLYFSTNSQRLSTALRERMVGGEEAWRCYEDMGEGGADAKLWAARLRDWRSKHTHLLRYNPRRGREMFPRNTRAVISYDMNTFYLGQPNAVLLEWTAQAHAACTMLSA